LTIAGSDSGGGAGVQADLKAFAAAGCFGMSAIVALTAQNTVGVSAVHEVPPGFVRAQLEAVFDDIGVDAAKTGMLYSREAIETVAGFLAEHPVPLVVDPVMIASSGAKLLADDAVATLVDRLFPLATVVTPNLPAKPDTILFNKVTIKGAKQAVQMFGPAQAAVARAVVDSVAEGVIPKAQANDLCILVGVFIHWQAEDDKKIYQFNYQATKESIARALQNKPSIDDVLAKYKAARHPFASGAEG